MRRLRWRRLFVVVAVMALVAAACDGDDDEAEEVETEEGAPEEEEEEFEGTVVTASEYEFDAPDEMSASTVDIRAVNDGSVAHEFAFVKIEDQEPEAFFEEFGPVLEGGPLPDAIFNGTVGPGLAQLQPAEDPIEAEMTLTEGNWLLFCALTDADTEGADDGGGGGDTEPAGRAQEETTTTGEEEPELPPHYELGMFQEITVTGDTEPEIPAGDNVITTVDYGFEGLDRLEAGDQTVVGANSAESQQLHHIVSLEIGRGIPAADAEEQFKALLQEEGGGGGGGGEEEPAGRGQEEEPEEAGGTFPMAPGYGTTFNLNLRSGYTYVFACFLQDREGGPPHAIGHDMFKAVAVS